MYWLLLPVDANAQRQLADETGRSNGLWILLRSRLQEALGAMKSLRRA
jgi:hypothetical protein